MMTPTNDTPRIAEGGTNVQGMGYTLTSAQKDRKKAERQKENEAE